MALKAGDEVDRYRIVAPLGAGGMGEVFHAFDTRLHRNVALKLLHAPKDGEPDGQSSGRSGPTSSRGSARMLREARAAAQLEHPNVVHVYDVGELLAPEELKGTAFLAMELIKGSSLRAFLKDASVPMAERIRWLADVARALSAAHAQGIVHRDIKPENVMLRHDGVIKVLDFGIAKRASYGEVDSSRSTEEPQIVPTLTTKGVAIGTPYYMSPEQMRGDALDGRADQFSWGVMAYELLVGQGPWRTDTDALGLVSQVLSKPVEFPREQNPEIPMHVAYVLVRALAKVREDRFPSMEALLTALDQTVDVPPAERSSARQLDPAAREELAAAKTEALPAHSTPGPLAQTTAPNRLTGDAPTDARGTPPARRRLVGLLVGATLLAVAGAGFMATRARPLAPAAVADAAPVVPGCRSNAECVASHEGKPYVCRAGDRTCVSLASEDCTVHAEPGDLARDDTVWVGTLFGGTDFNQRGVELARRDFAGMPAVLPGRTGNVSRRPLGVIACDDLQDPSRAARHLVEEVGVPAVIGFSKSQEAIDLLTGTLVPHGVLTIVSVNTSSLITSIRTPEGKPRGILRTTNNTLQMARALAAFVADTVEPKLHAERKRPLRVVLLRPPNAGGLGFSDAVVSTLRFNGATVAENQGAFTEEVLANATSPDDALALEVQKRVAAARPDIVVYYGQEFVRQVIAPVDATWPPREPRPTYISGLPLDDKATVGVGLHRRMYGITTPSNTPINAKFTLHYNATFADKITPTVSPASAYDGFYVLAYATYALGAAPVTGESLAGSVKRLVGGPTHVEVGPAKVLEALGVLGGGGSIDLQGAASDLDFDLATGESPTDHVILCVGTDVKGSPTPIESGLVWDAKTGKLHGTMKCPP